MNNRILVCLFILCSLSARGREPVLLPTRRAPSPDLVVVDGSDGRELLLYSAVTAKLGGGPRIPFLLVRERVKAGDLTHLGVKSVLLSSKGIWHEGELESHYLEELDIYALSLRLATAFWGRPMDVVLVKSGDPQQAILAACYAMEMRAPLIISADPSASVDEVMRILKPQHLHLVGHAAAKLSQKGVKHISLENTQKARQLAGPKTVILVRVPQQKGEMGSGWLAPYMALRRRGFVVFCTSPEVGALEEQTRQQIAKHNLKPRSITLLGDQEMIGTSIVAIKGSISALGSGESYEAEIEPFVYARPGTLPRYAVGRIPFADAARASTLLAHTYARERARRENRRVVMVANPSPVGGPLPLAECVAKVTAKEIRNFRYRIDEFYGQVYPGDVRDSLVNADLIVYQGHITDQRLLDDPSFFMDDDLSMPIPTLGSEILQPDYRSDMNLPFYLSSRPAKLSLQKQPVLILQSCKSQQVDTISHFVSLGGSAIIGSRSSIHSASGSAFIHCLIGDALYRRSTLGEALLSARNYFICLQGLKDLRGHKEQGKSCRVAFSFCLWGDPEAVLLSHHLREPSRSQLKAEYLPTDQVVIQIPSKRLNAVRTQRYTTSLFPGCQAAGMVRGSRDATKPRKVLPIYYFVLPAPKASAQKGFTGISHPQLPRRAAFLHDPVKQQIHVVYFPKKESANERVLLDFVR